MSAQARYLNILSKIIPAGAVSASLLLGSATASEASLTDAQPSASATLRVSQRLGAIREAVSDIMIGANIDPDGGMATPQMTASGALATAGARNVVVRSPTIPGQLNANQ